VSWAVGQAALSKFLSKGATGWWDLLAEYREVEGFDIAFALAQFGDAVVARERNQGRAAAFLLGRDLLDELVGHELGPNFERVIRWFFIDLLCERVSRELLEDLIEVLPQDSGASRPMTVNALRLAHQYLAARDPAVLKDADPDVAAAARVIVENMKYLAGSSDNRVGD
jgi:hypothetical protein